MDSRQLILRRVGANIRTARTVAGMTQEELALAAGLDRTYVGGAERGERNIGVVNLCRLAVALETPPDALLKGTDCVLNGCLQTEAP